MKKTMIQKKLRKKLYNIFFLLYYINKQFTSLKMILCITLVPSCIFIQCTFFLTNAVNFLLLKTSLTFRIESAIKNTIFLKTKVQNGQTKIKFKLAGGYMGSQGRIQKYSTMATFMEERLSIKSLSSCDFADPLNE